ncbi:MAG: HAD family hydrolase [Dehalococcoidia bacterium]|nr:HAD family hydrolase [Dehalococcoidia bacterium]
MTASTNGHIRWVFFDFVGTLAFNDPARIWHYLKALGRRGVFVERRQMWDAINTVWGRMDSAEGIAHPEASSDEAAYDAFRIEREAEVLAMIGVDAARRPAIIEEILSAQDSPEAYSLYPEVEPTLDKLAQAGYGIAVVSNFSWNLPHIVAGLGLGSHIDTVVTSARVGYRKPHPRIFEAALEAVDGAAARCLFVGDSFGPDVQGPAAHGFHTLLVDRRRSGKHETPTIAFLSELEEFLELPGVPGR